MDFIKAHAKSLLAGAAAILAVVQAAISDGVVTSSEKYGIVIALLTAVGVYLVPNQQEPQPK